MRHEDLLAQTDWSVVEHAYAGDPDAPSSPEILAALLTENAGRQGRALHDLCHVVHHQGGIYSATAPVARFVAAVLDDPRTLTPVLPRHGIRGVMVPLRVALLRWLTSVMQHITEPDGRRRGFPADVAACRAIRPSVYRAAYAMRTDPDPAVASEALGTLLACLLDAPELADHRAEAAAWSRGGRALAGLDKHARVMAVMTLQSWGYDTKPAMETDPDPVVRAAAALSPANADSIQGTRALLEVLSAPSAAVWCKRDYPHFGPIFMSDFLPAAIDRATLDDLTPVLDVLLAGAPRIIYLGDWGGRLRMKAFPGGFPPVEPLDTAQRALLNVIAARCFSPDSPRMWSSGDARMALRALVPEGAVPPLGATGFLA
ncbi:hypothetical protein [Nonomuraea jiangxiensis]|uniref:Uncharacterized protein n=1 Tax=Nonomuraea jiangxiensis TaxID=633440 RepID=A0A1G9I5U2_9ACTN|nr:hypothetical protein [Nonomuraea jiangxiensis]SDL20173.1 hypothetical protein SAMN05421869_12381 [Nonomuraea jiangxiensis]